MATINLCQAVQHSFSVSNGLNFLLAKKNEQLIEDVLEQIEDLRLEVPSAEGNFSFVILAICCLHLPPAAIVAECIWSYAQPFKSYIHEQPVQDPILYYPNTLFN